MVLASVCSGGIVVEFVVEVEALRFCCGGTAVESLVGAGVVTGVSSVEAVFGTSLEAGLLLR